MAAPAALDGARGTDQLFTENVGLRVLCVQERLGTYYSDDRTGFEALNARNSDEAQPSDG
jgi:hypothetical protein